MNGFHRFVFACFLVALALISSAPAQAQDNCDPIGGGLEFCAAETAFQRLEDGDLLYTNARGASGSETFLDFRIFDPIDPMPSYDEAFPMALDVMAQEYGITAVDFEPLPLFDSEVGIAGQTGEMRFYNVGAGRISDFAFDLTFGIALLLDERQIVVGTSTEMARQPGFDHIGDVFLALKVVRPEGGANVAAPAEPAPEPVPAATAASGGCDDIGQGVSFCFGETAFTPFDAGDVMPWYQNGREGRDLAYIWFTANEGLNAEVSDERLMSLVLESDAVSFGIDPDELNVVVPPRPADIAGQTGLEAYFVIPGANNPGTPNDTIHSRALLNTGGSYVIVHSSGFGTIPSANHVMDVEAARAAVRLPGAAAAAELQAMMAPPTVPECDALGAGLQLCDLRGIGWDGYTAIVEGGVQVSIGDTTAEMWAEPYRGYAPPISEDARLDLQDDLHGRMVNLTLENLGIPANQAGIDYLLGMRVGRADEAPVAQFMTMFYDSDTGPVTQGVTVFLRPDAYVTVLSRNPGRGTTEDHFFLVEELMRGVRVPG